MGKRKRSGSFSKSDETGAKRSDPEDSQEELDSEIMACSSKGVSGSGGGGGIGGGVGTRCSARVQEKQEKLRRESSPSKQIFPLEVNCSSSVTPTGNVTSNVSKGSVKYPSPNNESASITSEVGVSTQIVPALEEKRKKRTWELWSLEDKQMFFEALNENGKDFDAIQNYLASKAKSRKSGICGQYATKNKDQVRHFYYRTWNKISKYLRFPDGMKKANQELYGLINYGELRKKQRILNSKTATKLCELVENGITSIKFRGKTCRIKTPVCRALKRLNGLDDVEHTRVPHKINVEFIPRDGKTWRSVQSVSHNPRVKVVSSLQRTFASIITYLENKWKRKDDRLKEQFSSVFGKPRARLRMIPAEADGRDFNLPLYRVAENTSSATICLRSYKKNVLVCELRDDNDFNSLKMKRKRKQSGGGNVATGSADVPDIPDVPVTFINNKRLANFDYPMDPETSDAESQIFPNQQSHFGEEQAHFLAEQSDENAVSMKDEIFSRHLRSLEDYASVLYQIGYPYPTDENQNGDINHVPTETDNDDVEHELDEAPEKFHEAGTKPVKMEKFVAHVWDEEQIRRGWTAEETGVMTVGELYFLMGQTEKICFEYFWDGPDSPEDSRNHNLLEKLITTATLLRKKKTSRSKATISNSVIKCGSHLKCSTCGFNVEFPPNPSCVSKTCFPSVPSANLVRTVSPLPRIKTNATPSTITNDKQLSVFPVHTTAESTVALTITPSVSILSPTTVNSSEYPRSNGFDSDKSNRLNRFQKVDPTCLNDNQMRFESVETLHDGISSVNGFNRAHNLDQKCKTSLMSFSGLNSNSTGKNDSLIELSSLATNHCNDMNIAPNIKATLLPPSSCMIRNPSGTISVVSQSPQEIGQGNNNRPKTEQITFHRPTQLRTLESAQPSGDGMEFPPPKPFLDLPKGNRRLGRRPNFKRVVIPRVLPLLPKNQTLVSIMSTTTDANTSNALSALGAVRKLSIIPTGEKIESSTAETKKLVQTADTTPGKNFSPEYSKESSGTRKCPETISYEMFMNVAGTLSCNSNDFEDLLKVKRNEGNGIINSGDVDSLSLSSFMEISLPESAKMTANEMNIDDMDSLNLLRLEKDSSKELITPESSPMKRLQASAAMGSDLMPDFDKAWSMDGGDLSLSNFFHFDSQRSNASETPESDVNFQMLDDGSLDFSSKITELTSPMSDDGK